MNTLLPFAFLAGLITVLSPCVLPVLPVVLSSTAGEGKRRPWGVVAGFIATFSLATLGLSTLVATTGLNPDLLRTLSGVIILAMAVVLVVPAIKNRFMQLATGVVSGGPRKATTRSGAPVKPRGFVAGFLTGLSLGLVWTPCVGPIMASVITLAVSQSVDAGAVAITLAYALGTALPLFAVMQGGRAILNRFPGLLARLDQIQRGFGILMIATSLAIISGFDRRIEVWLLDTFPGWGQGLTAWEANTAIQEALDQRSGFNQDQEIPDRSGSDPLERTAGSWFNSEPLTLAGLEGKVVLVDFWTYSCVNCVRTVPWLRSWHQAYADEGLVVISVHSPEFAFEAREENLVRAMGELGVTWPVVQDNDFGIWNAFSNRFWPAHYLFDRQGALVHTHFGEGGEEDTEAKIREILGTSAAATAPSPSAFGAADDATNPETYLGSLRGLPLVEARWTPSSGADKAMPDPGTHRWLAEGGWTQADEYIESPGGEEEGILYLDLDARGVYLVLGLGDGGAPGTGTAELEVDVVDDSGRSRGPHLIQPGVDGLYTLVEPGDFLQGTLVIRARGSVRLYAFTFS